MGVVIIQYINGDPVLFWNVKLSLTLILFRKIYLKKSAGLLDLSSLDILFLVY